MPSKSKRIWQGPCSGRTDSVCDSEPDFSFLDLEENGSNCSLVLNHRTDEFDVDPLPFQPHFLLQELLVAHCAYLQRLPATAVRSWIPLVQSRLGLAERGCRLRMHHSAGVRDCELPNLSQFSWPCSPNSLFASTRGDLNNMSFDSGGAWEQQVVFSNSSSSKCGSRKVCAQGATRDTQQRKSQECVGPLRRTIRRTCNLLPWMEATELRRTCMAYGVLSMDAARF